MSMAEERAVHWKDVYAYYWQGELAKWISLHGVGSNTASHFKARTKSFEQLDWTLEQIDVDQLRERHTAPNVAWIQDLSGIPSGPVTVADLAKGYEKDPEREPLVAYKVRCFEWAIREGMIPEVRLILIDEICEGARDTFISDGNTRALAVAVSKQWGNRPVTLYRGILK